ncbi:hypothetical protein THAOC_07644, partial [Thalassiosira oceanica]
MTLTANRTRRGERDAVASFGLARSSAAGAGGADAMRRAHSRASTSLSVLLRVETLPESVPLNSVRFTRYRMRNEFRRKSNACNEPYFLA